MEESFAGVWEAKERFTETQRRNEKGIKNLQKYLNH